ncbi:MAG: ATP-binding cassette domain-containing protein, partial [Chloroflexi bacterium]|nr:ATP-binding cassette domain-containing protein [Chloroflexota bacterium]
MRFHAIQEHSHGHKSIVVKDVVVRYGDVVALDRVSLEVDGGERVAVVGPNGSGKSTLLKVIAGVIQPERGQVDLFGSAPQQHICVAYVPQRSLVDWDFPVNVYDVVMMGRVGRLGLLRWPGKRDHEMVVACLNEVGMQGLAKRQIGELSSG